MIRNITQNDLILLAYNEFTPDRQRQLMDSVNTDPRLRKAFQKINAQLALLDTAIAKPHPTSVQIIMEESCSSSPMQMI